MRPVALVGDMKLLLIFVRREDVAPRADSMEPIQCFSNSSLLRVQLLNLPLLVNFGELLSLLLWRKIQAVFAPLRWVKYFGKFCLVLCLLN